jgi:hypothetical protein
VAGAITLLFVPACKKTVEGETKSWNRNLQRVQRLKTLYPGFAAALDAREKKAQEAMAAAKKLNKANAPKMMAAANSQLMSGFVGKLDRVDSKIKRLRSQALSATSGARDRSDRMAARRAADDARSVLREVKELLRNGAETPAAALTILSKVEGDLRFAKRNLDRVIKVAKDKRKAAKKEAKVRERKAAKKEAAKRPWKCSYCDHKNPATALKCKNCNAPR